MGGCYRNRMSNGGNALTVFLVGRASKSEIKKFKDLLPKEKGNSPKYDFWIGERFIAVCLIPAPVRNHFNGFLMGACSWEINYLLRWAMENKMSLELSTDVEKSRPPLKPAKLSAKDLEGLLSPTADKDGDVDGIRTITMLSSSFSPPNLWDPLCKTETNMPETPAGLFVWAALKQAQMRELMLVDMRNAVNDGSHPTGFWLPYQAGPVDPEDIRGAQAATKAGTELEKFLHQRKK